MSLTPLPWSHSSLSTFVNCPRQYYEVKVIKSVKDEPGEAALWGDYVHKEFEKSLLAYGAPLPNDLRQFQPYIDRLAGMSGKQMIELKLGLNAAKQPCDFLADDVWTRGIIDYLNVKGDRALVVDHKTGKIKPSRQLVQNALMIFAHFPAVQTVDVVFYWLKFNDKTHRTYTRDQIPEMWAEYEDDLAAYEQAFRLDTWVERPSGLCYGWCPVTHCPHWAPKKRRR